jgi:hypothetical protein
MDHPLPTPPSPKKGPRQNGPDKPLNHPHLHALPDNRFELEALRRQVEADARPLFIAAMIWITHQALKLDEDEPA